MFKVFQFVFLSLSFLGFSQNPEKDTLTNHMVKKDMNLKFDYKALIIPSALIGYGVAAVHNPTLLDLNRQAEKEVFEHIDEKVSIDDFAQYSPTVAAYILNVSGIKGKHDLKNMTILLGTSFIIMNIFVLPSKGLVGEQRPDYSAYNSFPSGHTATAFMGAEFLWQEYKDVSVWYGITGYAVASFTGFYRVLNDRHWVNDVLAGAGIGMLSTKIAYWIFPYTQKIFTKRDTNKNMILLPTYINKSIGLNFQVQF